MADTTSYDARFLTGIAYFNACEFFEAHEIWEELWADSHGEARPFYQGLIQVAVCLHHFGNGNTRGARKLYHTSRAYLENFRPVYHGVDLDAFLSRLEECCREILVSSEEFPRVEIDPETIPEIWPDPPPSTWPPVELPSHDD
ncbi:MAG: DUF309 domain-containing protein [Planctomycetota bacterium]|nr:DUF309 domain-containing protein [Planctomycetota bacterium]